MSGDRLELGFSIHSTSPLLPIWLETHCPGILVTPRLFLFYLNKSDPIRILVH